MLYKQQIFHVQPCSYKLHPMFLQSISAKVLKISCFENMRLKG